LILPWKNQAIQYAERNWLSARSIEMKNGGEIRKFAMKTLLFGEKCYYYKDGQLLLLEIGIYISEETET